MANWADELGFRQNFDEYDHSRKAHAAQATAISEKLFMLPACMRLLRTVTSAPTRTVQPAANVAVWPLMGQTYGQILMDIYSNIHTCNGPGAAAARVWGADNVLRRPPV